MRSSVRRVNAFVVGGCGRSKEPQLTESVGWCERVVAVFYRLLIFENRFVIILVANVLSVDSY